MLLKAKNLIEKIDITDILLILGAIFILIAFFNININLGLIALGLFFIVAALLIHKFK